MPPAGRTHIIQCISHQHHNRPHSPDRPTNESIAPKPPPTAKQIGQAPQGPDRRHAGVCVLPELSPQYRAAKAGAGARREMKRAWQQEVSSSAGLADEWGRAGRACNLLCTVQTVLICGWDYPVKNSSPLLLLAAAGGLGETGTQGSTPARAEAEARDGAAAQSLFRPAETLWPLA
jgi:hypothetical protein